MAFQQGTQINPRLADIDFSPISETAEVEAAAQLGLAESISNTLSDYQDKQKEKQDKKVGIKAIMDLLDVNKGQATALYNDEQVMDLFKANKEIQNNKKLVELKEREVALQEDEANLEQISLGLVAGPDDLGGYPMYSETVSKYKAEGTKEQKESINSLETNPYDPNAPALIDLLFSNATIEQRDNILEELKARVPKPQVTDSIDDSNIEVADEGEFEPRDSRQTKNLVIGFK